MSTSSLRRRKGTRDGAIHVLVVAHGPPMRGGIATVALDLVQDPGLNAEFDVELLNTAQNDEARGRFSALNVRRALDGARATFMRSRPGTVVHTHSVHHPGLVAWRQVLIAIAARLRGAAVVSHNHAGPPCMEPPGSWEVGRLNRWGFAALDRLVEANVVIAAAAVPNLGRYMRTAPMPVVHNSVVVSDVTPTTADHDPPVVLFIGELLERKGVTELLDALDLLDDRGVGPFDLRIIGDDRAGLDPDKDEMVASIRARGRGDTLTGPLERSDVYEHLAAADVVVFPTHTEGQPFAVIESLAAGVPIVASDIRAISNMIDDRTHGRLVPVRDPAALADALAEMLGDPDERRRISAANRLLAHERFDRDLFRSRVAAIYRATGNSEGRRCRLRAGRVRVAAIDR